MARTPAVPHGTVIDNSQLDRLVLAVEEVARQVQVLRQVLDEIREEVVWAVRNDIFRTPPSECRCTNTSAGSEPDAVA